MSEVKEKSAIFWTLCREYSMEEADMISGNDSESSATSGKWNIIIEPSWTCIYTYT